MEMAGRDESMMPILCILTCTAYAGLIYYPGGAKSRLYFPGGKGRRVDLRSVLVDEELSCSYNVPAAHVHVQSMQCVQAMIHY